MPTYNFRNKETGEETEEFMSIADLDKFKEDNPHLEQFLTKAPGLVGGVMGLGRMKTDGGWKDMLSRIGDAHPGSKVHDLYSHKSVKEVKTRQVLEKHKKIQAQKNKGK